MANCPHCDRPHDISRRLHSDRIYCLCGKWCIVIMRTNGDTYLAACDPPMDWLERKNPHHSR